MLIWFTSFTLLALVGLVAVVSRFVFDSPFDEASFDRATWLAMAGELFGLLLNCQSSTGVALLSSARGSARNPVEESCELENILERLVATPDHEIYVGPIAKDESQQSSTTFFRKPRPSYFLIRDSASFLGGAHYDEGISHNDFMRLDANGISVHPDKSVADPGIVVSERQIIARVCKALLLAYGPVNPRRSRNDIAHNTISMMEHSNFKGPFRFTSQAT